MSPTYVLGLVFAGIILVTVFVKMRNSGLKESYGLWWYWIAFFTALLSLFPPILKWTAFHLGVVVPLNLGFFVAGVVLLLLSLRFSVDLSRADEDRRRLTEEAAILRLQVERLERRVEALEERASSQGESGASQTASSSHDKAAPQGKKHKKKRCAASRRLTHEAGVRQVEMPDGPRFVSVGTPIGGSAACVPARS